MEAFFSGWQRDPDHLNKFEKKKNDRYNCSKFCSKLFVSHMHSNHTVYLSSEERTFFSSLCQALAIPVKQKGSIPLKKLLQTLLFVVFIWVIIQIFDLHQISFLEELLQLEQEKTKSD
jgi:hypothetical protein